MDTLLTYLKEDLVELLGVDRARLFTKDNSIQVTYLINREAVLLIRGDYIDDTFVIYFIKTYTQERRQGLCTSLLQHMKSTSPVKMVIFQVVSNIMNRICEKLQLEKTDATVTFSLSRDDVCTTGAYYSQDYGDYILVGNPIKLKERGKSNEINRKI